MSGQQKDQGRPQGLEESFTGVAGMRPVQGDQKKSFNGAANLKPAVVSPPAQDSTPAEAPAAQSSETGAAAPTAQGGDAGK